MLVWISNFKETVPETYGVVHPPLIYVIIDNSVIGRIKIKTQRIRQVIIYRILPIKHKIPLIQSGKTDLIRQQIEFSEFLLIKIPDNITAYSNIAR